MAEQPINDTFNERRLYSSTPFLKVFDEPFRIKKGNLLPELKAFVLQRQNEWGDPLPFDLQGFDITFRLYDEQDNLVAQGDAEVSDGDAGEIQYQWKEFDIVTTGNFRGEFVFKKQGQSFVLPNVGTDLRIVSFA